MNIIMGEDGTSVFSVYKLSNDQSLPSVMGRNYEIGRRSAKLDHGYVAHGALVDNVS